MSVFITTFDVNQMFKDFKKILKLIDKSKLKEEQKDLVHSLLDLKHPRFEYHKMDISWKDMLLSFDNVVPNTATEEEKEDYRKFLESLAKGKSDRIKKEEAKENGYSEETAYEIRKMEIRNKQRFVIFKMGTNEILDDASGYGYSTKEKAQKSAWYKFKGGKEMIEQASEWWKKQSRLSNKVLLFIKKHNLENFDDAKTDHYTRTIKYIRKKCEKLKIEGFKDSYLKSLRKLM